MRHTGDVILLVLAPIAILLVPAVVVMGPKSPDVRQCPSGYDLRMGVRTDGRFQCWPHPSAPRGWDGGPIEEWDGTWLRPEKSVQTGTIVDDRIHCSNGARPIVVDHRTVGCQRMDGAQ